MYSKHIIAACIMASVSVLPANRVAAGNNALAGAIIGGIIGGAIVNSSQRQRTTTPRTTTRRSSATRAANRETQTSLNYFGFPAGTPDGALGRRSRAAISSYQVYLGYPVTGYLLQHERDFLVNSYNRALIGGANTADLIASSDDGVRGLLIAYREEQAGGNRAYAGRTIGGLPKEVSASVFEIAKSSDPSAQQLIQRSGFVQLADINGDGQTDYILDTSVTGSAFWCNAQSCAVRVFASTPDGYQRNDFQAFNVTPALFSCQRGNCVQNVAPTTQMAAAPVVPQTLPQTQQAGLPVASAVPAVRSIVPAAAPLALPNFLGTPGGGVSLASHCNQVSLLTNSNGGFVTLASMSDPAFTLNEQFCLARTYAISKGEELAAKIPGATPAQLEQQCGAFGPAMQSHISALSVKDRAQVMQEVSGFVLSTGMTPVQLAGTAKICLSVGYRTDNLDVAVASALLLTALGEQAYGELLGHHLTQGFGVSKRPDLALGWYQASLDAMDAGAPAVFAPGNFERNTLLRRAAFPGSASNQPAVIPASQAAPAASTLPVFSLTAGASE